MADPISVFKDAERAGFLLTTLSPNARKMIDMETWRTFVSSDEGDEEHILPLLFQALITDMETIGISCTVDYNALSIDGIKFFAFLNLCRLIMPSTLYPFVMEHTELRDTITTIADGTYFTSGSVIQTWIDRISGLDGLPPIIPGMQEIADFIRQDITSDSRFMDYLQTMMENLQLSRLATPVDPDKHTAYLEVLKPILWRSRELSVRLVDIIPDEGKTGFQTALKRFTRDLVASDELIDNHYLFLRSPQTLPDDLHERYAHRWDCFKISFPLFSQYYMARNIPLDIKAYALILCGFTVTCSDQDAYQKAVQEFLQNHPEAKDAFAQIDLIGGIYE